MRLAQPLLRRAALPWIRLSVHGFACSGNASRLRSAPLRQPPRSTRRCCAGWNVTTCPIGPSASFVVPISAHTHPRSAWIPMQYSASSWSSTRTRSKCPRLISSGRSLFGHLRRRPRRVSDEWSRRLSPRFPLSFGVRGSRELPLRARDQALPMRRLPILTFQSWRSCARDSHEPRPPARSHPFLRKRRGFSTPSASSCGCRTHAERR